MNSRFLNRVAAALLSVTVIALMISVPAYAGGADIPDGAASVIELVNNNSRTRTITVDSDGTQRTAAESTDNKSIYYIGDYDISKIDSIDIRAAFAERETETGDGEPVFINIAYMNIDGSEEVTAEYLDTNSSAIRDNNHRIGRISGRTTLMDVSGAAQNNAPSNLGALYSVDKNGVTVDHEAYAKFPGGTAYAEDSSEALKVKGDGAVHLFLWATAQKGRAVLDYVRVYTDTDPKPTREPETPRIPQIIIGNAEFAENKTVIPISVINPNEETENGTLMAAVYDGDNKFCKLTIVKDGKAEFTDFRDGYVKAFLWSAITGENAMMPLTDAKYRAIEEAVPEVIDLKDAELSGGTSYQNKNGYANAFDGDISTYFDGDKGSYCTVNLKRVYKITELRFYPRGGRSADKPAEYVKRLIGGVFSGSSDGETWQEIYTVPSSVYTNDTDAETLKWYAISVNAEYKYIKYENSNAEANIAEIELYGIPSSAPADTTQKPATPTPATPTPVPETVPAGFTVLSRTDWTAESNSVQDTAKTAASLVLDGKDDTIWHSKNNPSELSSDKTNNPIYLTVDMGKKQSVSLVRYTPRIKGSAAGTINGVITAYELYMSEDNLEWTKITEGNLGYTVTGVQLPENIIFAPVETRYLRLVARDNLCNTSTYLASCAEFNAYKYDGDMKNHPITAAREELNKMIERLNEISSDSEIKVKLIEKANQLKVSGSVDAIEEFMASAETAAELAAEALSWAEKGVNDMYINRLMDYLADRDVSAEAVEKVNAELDGFRKTGAEVCDTLSSSWQGEFKMTEEEKSLTLYERTANAVARAKERIDSDDGRDYKMLKELVSYVSGKNGYAGYENSYGMDAASCEAVVSNINFALSNLQKADSGELETELSEFTSGEIWLDDNGSKISAHGGQIIKQGDTYYWYGEDNKISYALKTGVSCYSSKDLKNWTYEGLAFKAFDDGTEEKQFTKEFLTDSISGTQGRIERPKVIYNAKNDNYVMWMHLEKDGGYSLSVMGVAVSDSPTGPFEWKWYGRPVCDKYVISESKHHFFRDMNLFVDDDDKAYLFVSSENNQVMYAIRLNDDYTWIDADDLESSGTSEEDIAPGKVITPDMTVKENASGGYMASSYTYGKKSFTRYQLASGGGVPLTNKKDADGNDVKDGNGRQIYVSTRADGLLCIPEYADGRWAKVGSNAPAENREEGKTETTVNNDITKSREAPAPIKIDGKYYLVTSSLSGWKANPSLTQTADSILGEWTKTGNPITGDGPVNGGRWSQNADRSTSFNSQSTCIIELPDGQFMYMGDRWKNGVYETENAAGTFPDVDVKASTYVWLPITFEDGSLTIRWRDAWTYGD